MSVGQDYIIPIRDLRSEKMSSAEFSFPPILPPVTAFAPQRSGLCSVHLAVTLACTGARHTWEARRGARSDVTSQSNGHELTVTRPPRPHTPPLQLPQLSGALG